MATLAHRAVAKYIHQLISDSNSIVHACNDPIVGDRSGEMVFWVQYPFKLNAARRKKDLGKQYRITITEDEF